MGSRCVDYGSPVIKAKCKNNQPSETQWPILIMHQATAHCVNLQVKHPRLMNSLSPNTQREKVPGTL